MGKHLTVNSSSDYCMLILLNTKLVKLLPIKTRLTLNVTRRRVNSGWEGWGGNLQYKPVRAAGRVKNFGEK